MSRKQKKTPPKPANATLPLFDGLDEPKPRARRQTLDEKLAAESAAWNELQEQLRRSDSWLKVESFEGEWATSPQQDKLIALREKRAKGRRLANE